MLAPASRPRRAAVVDLLAPDAALTDPDPAARPAPNENHLLINAYSTHPQSPLLPVTRRISDSGCNLVDTRLSTVGRDVSVTALATRSEEHTSELQSLMRISYAVFCLKKTINIIYVTTSYFKSCKRLFIYDTHMYLHIFLN